MHVVIQQLCKKYGSKQVLNGINLTLSKGMFGLLVPNGAGKSTLMQILATVIPKSSGDVQIGHCKLGSDELEIRSLLGYLPQEFGVYRKLTGAEYLDYVASMKGITNGKARREAVTEMLHDSSTLVIGKIWEVLNKLRNEKWQIRLRKLKDRQTTHVECVVENYAINVTFRSSIVLT